MSRFTATLLAAAAALTLSAAASAQTFPSKQVTWVVPYPPGGPTDIIARIVGGKLGEQLGQTVIVENRAGADGNVGTLSVANSAPDGHTILFVVPGVVTNPLFIKASPDPFATLAPVIQMDTASMVLLASSKFGPKSVAEIVAQAKARPDSISCGSSGALPTMGCELLQARSGKLTMVRYRGNGPALAAIGSGEIDLLFDVVNTARTAVDGGRALAIASTNPKRGIGPFKDSPVLAETIPDFVLITWHGVMVAKATPAPVIARLNTALKAAIHAPEVKARMEQLGFEVTGTTADEFGKILRDEADKYGKILAAAGIKPE